MRIIEPPKNPPRWAGQHTCENCECCFYVDLSDRDAIKYSTVEYVESYFWIACPSCGRKVTLAVASEYEDREDAEFT